MGCQRARLKSWRYSCRHRSEYLRQKIDLRDTLDEFLKLINNS